MFLNIQNMTKHYEPIHSSPIIQTKSLEIEDLTDPVTNNTLALSVPCLSARNTIVACNHILILPVSSTLCVAIADVEGVVTTSSWTTLPSGSCRLFNITGLAMSEIAGEWWIAPLRFSRRAVNSSPELFQESCFQFSGKYQRKLIMFW